MLLGQNFNKHCKKENNARQGEKLKLKERRYNIVEFWKEGGMCLWGLDFISNS